MDWSHNAWNEWREGVAILSKTPFTATGSRFASHNKSHNYWRVSDHLGIFSPYLKIKIENDFDVY
jgi:hypothetical protein